MNKILFEIDTKEFPILANIEKDKINDYIKQIFKTGYNIHFPVYQAPEYNHIITKLEQVHDSLKDTNIKDYLLSLDTSLNKLIGLSSNSSKKGNFAENVLESIFSTRYGDIKFERKSGVAHSGDAWLYLPDNTIIILESKNYITTVGKEEILKLQNDMVEHNIKWALMVSFNSQIQGTRELDFHTFIHNRETYSVVMISNLSSNMSKLDLGLQVIRKLITTKDTANKVLLNPLLINNINDNLVELNKIIEQNYLLRDSYYTMEQNINKSLSSYHTILRDYQYDIEIKIKEITDKLNDITDQPKILNNYTDILELFQGKKTLPIVTRLLDIVKSKDWSIDSKDNSNWIISSKEKVICNVNIQLKKIVVVHNQIELTFFINKDNQQNYNILQLFI
jgi:hypothetical protein